MIIPFYSSISQFYQWMLSRGDPRVVDWPLMATPGPVLVIFFLYLAAVRQGPKVMDKQKPMEISKILVVYNIGMVALSAYMCYEFLVTSLLAGYSYTCQPVDYTTDPLALRMARVCWWYFFSKFIEFLDTIFLIVRKKDVSFLHAYHHSTMLINWWLGVKYIAGGQSWFLAMLNTFVHVIMYSYYGLSALGPRVQKYLWWKKYLTRLQLSQFVAVIIHTSINLLQPNCDFPKGYNVAVGIYAISLIVLFSNFYEQTYKKKDKFRVNKYFLRFQSQFVAVIIHTSINLLQPNCDFPKGYNVAVGIYAISLIVLFSNFYEQTYKKKDKFRVNKYFLRFQSQFVAVIIHTSINLLQPNCDFPKGYNIAVGIYAISLIVLFSNFYEQTYRKKDKFNGNANTRHIKNK